MSGRRYFGTDGVRGLAGVMPMTADFAFRLGVATVETLKVQGQDRPHILIGMDTRQSGPMLAHAAAAGISSRGGDVLWLGVMPTPGVSYLTRALGADAGIVVSASHNPYYDNGIKLFNSVGEKLSDGTEAEIEERLELDLAGLEPITSERVGNSRRYRKTDGEYLRFLLDHAPYLDGLKVGLDCANGASVELAPHIFERLGARLDVINARPDGQNINVDCGSTHPETMQQRVGSHELDVGITFDGDADRALLVDRKCRLVTGDHILAICALSRGESEVVATLMSNLGVERFLESHGITLHRTRVGDRYVAEEMRSRGLNLGGEQSGHMLFLDLTPTGDGILTALQVLSAVRKSGRPLEAWMDLIPTYPQKLFNIPVQTAVRDHVAGTPRVRALLEEAERELAGDGRVNIRPSGTEPLVRVMVEAPDEAQVDSLGARLSEVVAEVGRELARS